MQKSDSEQNGLLFTTDTSRPRSKRPLSILKVRQPSLDSDDFENTVERKLRRVSFSESHEVWEFQAHHLGKPFVDAQNTEEADENLCNSSNFLCASDKKNILDVLSFGAKRTTAYGSAANDVSAQSKTVAALDDSEDIFTSSRELPKKNGAGNRTFYDGHDMDVTECLTSAVNLNSSLWKPDENGEDVLNSHEPHQTYSTMNRTIYDVADMDVAEMTECLTGVVALGSSSIAHNNATCNLANMSSLVEDSEVVFNSCEPRQISCGGQCLPVVDPNSLETSSDLLDHKNLSDKDKFKSIQDGSADDVSLTECVGKFLDPDASFKNPMQTIIFSKFEGEVEETECIEPELPMFTNWNTMDTEVFSESELAKINDSESDAGGIASKNNTAAAAAAAPLNRSRSNVLYAKENVTKTLMPMQDYNGILPSCSLKPKYVTDSEILRHKQTTSRPEKMAANVVLDFCGTTKLNISNVIRGQVSDVLGVSKPSKCLFEESNKENVVGSCVNMVVDSKADILYGKSKHVAEQQELPFVNATSKQASLQHSIYSTIFPSSFSLPSNISVCEVSSDKKSCSKPDRKVVNTTEICGTTKSNISSVVQSQISGIIGEGDVSKTRKLWLEKNNEDEDFAAERQIVCQPEAVSVSKSKDMTRYLSFANVIPAEISTQNSMRNTVLPCASFLPENVKECEISRGQTSFDSMDVDVFSGLCENSKIGISSIGPDLTDFSGIVSIADDTCKRHFEKNNKTFAEDSVASILAIPELKDLIRAEELMEQSELPVMNVTSSEISAKNILHYSLFLCDPALPENVPECKILDDEQLYRRQDQAGVNITADFHGTSRLNVLDNARSQISGIADVQRTSKTCEHLFEKSSEGLVESVSEGLISSEPKDSLATNSFGLSKEPEVPSMNEIPKEPRLQDDFNDACNQAAHHIGSIDVLKTPKQLPNENNPDYTEDSIARKPIISEPENNLVSHLEDLIGQPELPTERVIEKKSPSQKHLPKLTPAFSSECQNGEIKLMSSSLVSAISDINTFEGDAPPTSATQLAATKSCDLKNANSADNCDFAIEEFRKINEEVVFLLRVRKVLKETLLRSLNHFLYQLPNRRENDRIVTWNVEDWDDFGCRITFLSRTLVLDVTFGEIIEDLEFCGRAAQKIKKVVLQSLLGGPMWPECELAHRLMHEVIDVSHLRRFKDTSQIDKVLHHILVSIFQAVCVKKDICQLDPLHFRHIVAIRGHRLNVKYLHPLSFTLSCDVHLPQLHITRPEWKVSLSTGEVREEDLLNQINFCNPGFHYLDDVFHQIRDWLKTLRPSSRLQLK